MGIEPIVHQMLQSALREIQDSQMLEAQAASRRDVPIARLKQFADPANQQSLPVLPQKSASFHEMLQLALEAIQDRQYATAAGQLQQLGDLADAQYLSASPQKDAVLQMFRLALNEIQDCQVLKTLAASRCEMAAAQLTQLADLTDKQYLSISSLNGKSFHQMLQSVLEVIANRQNAAAIAQLQQLADQVDKMLAPAWEKLLARCTVTLQTRLRAALADPTTSTVDAEKCRIIESQLHKCLQGKDFSGALKTLDQLEPALKKAVFEGNLAKGEGQKRQDQTRAYEAMQDRFGIIGTTVFRTGFSNQIAIKHQRQASPTFLEFIGAMKVHEHTRSEATLKNLETHGRMFPRSDATAEETQIVREVMQWARFDGLRLEYEKIGPPRWDAEKENRAGALTAAYLFEEGALHSRTGEDKTAKPLEDESGVSGAWWIRRLGGVSDEETVRLFIFKPVDREPDFAVLPLGGGAIREAMAKAVNDQVALMTGLDFGVCPTFLVGVSNERLPDADGRPDTTLGPIRTGAMQQLAANRGSVEDSFNDEGPAFFKKIPTEEVNKVAILDLIILNFDRHGRNTLVDGYPPHMIPIDHGKSLPTREGFSKGKHEIESKNFLLGHGAPQMDEQFSPEMLTIIDLIDPDRLAQEMKATRDALVKQHPDQRDMLGDESVEMARRSVLFLKKAASQLTIRELMRAYTTALEPVFDAHPDQLEVAIDNALRAAFDGRVTAQQLDAYGWHNARKELTALGWFTKNPNIPSSIMSPTEQETFLNEQGGRVLKILQGRIENPAVRKHFDELILEVGAENLTVNPNALSIQEALTLVKKAADEHKKEDLEEFRLPAQVEMGADLSALDGDDAKEYAAAVKLLADLKEFQEAGGDTLISEKERGTPKEKLEAYGRKLMAECSDKEDPETYFKRMRSEFGGDLDVRSSTLTLAKARYLEDCQEFQRLGGKAKYHRLVGRPYSTKRGLQSEMIDMLKAESDTSVDGVNLDAALNVGLQRLLTKVASAPQGQTGGLKRRIEQYLGNLSVNLNLNSGQYDAAWQIFAEMEAEVDRVVQGDNSDVAKLDRRIEAARDKITKLQSSPEEQAIATALQAVEDFRKAWKLPQCETALGKLEKSVDMFVEKRAALADRRRQQKESKLGALETRLESLHQEIQKLKKNPYLKGRYNDFSRRYWDAVKSRNEWNIGEATQLIDRIEQEMKAVQALVPGAEAVQKRIDKAVEQTKGLPAKMLADEKYKTDVGSLIPGARKLLANLGRAPNKPGDNTYLKNLGTELKFANGLLDDFESRLPKFVEKYRETQ